ncbi:putative bifunctional diguanylate cyclase/phosphodiesterase [Cellulomonas marina]|uniref:Diguanylate cyclase (GGDEF) domain-containing protein n=1 Tax=Cellulomonas marina TaxID=988821 RepID=A0A1I0YF28_9CELL|nr:sensor domain-containing phosphodiesterase [Cellulomonas marina]GIG28760.1 hypothetical protein Cma02nite_13600 [Cellulomonas marina]SFB11366.1 diguanylate cyclase (GGDEF) domain-containing protein [Cellulomonas marina]
MTDLDALERVLATFTGAVLGEVDAHEVLRLLAEGVAEVLALPAAGVLVADEGGRLSVVHTTDPASADVEAVQAEQQSGPGVEARASGEVLDVGDLAAEGRWPAFMARAAERGLAAVTTVPLVARGRTWGTLDVFRAEPGRLPGEDLAVLEGLARLATLWVVLASDRDEARTARAELADHAMHDALTGLPLRWVLLELLERALARAARAGARAGSGAGGGTSSATGGGTGGGTGSGTGSGTGTVALLFLDVDGLKYVNDVDGHAAGDALLRACARRARARLRPPDVLARIGGDELVVLLEDVRSPAEAVAVAQRVVSAVAEPLVLPGRTVTPSVSVGVAVADDPAVRPETLLARADAAMYRAKRAGRGGVAVEDPEGYARDLAAHATPSLVADLRAALDADALEVHYQPVQDVGPDPSRAPTGAAWGVEALVRWRHPVRGLLSGGQVLDVAGAGGLERRLGRFVVARAVAQLADWDRGLGARSPQRLFVNLSAAELADPALPATVRALLDAGGVAPERLLLDVTEGSLLGEEAERGARALVAEGCGLSLDDLGGGWSSLRRVLDVPARVLKVDRSLTRRLRRREAAAVVGALLEMGRALGRDVVLEGVEDEATLAVARELGCAHVQGFHLGAPQTADELSARLGAAAR